jgi:hypothetical protein
MHFPHAIHCNQPHLVVQVELVDMALVKHELKKQSNAVYIHTPEFSGLKLRPLIGVQTHVSQLTEFDMIKRNLGAQGLSSSGYESVEFDLLGNLGLVRQELNLLETHYIRELNNDLLRVFAELGRLPTPTLGRVV